MTTLPRIYVIFSFVVFFACLQASEKAVLGQAPGVEDPRSRFNGEWLYDPKKSTTHSSLKELYKDQSLTITFAEPKLAIKKVQTKDGVTKEANLVLFTDKRGEANNPFPFNEEQRLESVTAWDKQTLVRVSVGEIPYKGSKLKIYIREVFTLSKDGNTLTITEETSTDTPAIFFPDRTKKVYQRK